jgi:hypothetical protein
LRPDSLALTVVSSSSNDSWVMLKNMVSWLQRTAETGPTRAMKKELNSFHRAAADELSSSAHASTALLVPTWSAMPLDLARHSADQRVVSFESRNLSFLVRLLDEPWV